MADDRNRAKFEAFIIKFQAGENKRIISECFAPLLILLFSLQELSGQDEVQGADGGEEQSSNQNPGPLQRPQGAENLQEEKVEDGKQIEKGKTFQCVCLFQGRKTTRARRTSS